MKFPMLCRRLTRLPRSHTQNILNYRVQRVYFCNKKPLNDHVSIPNRPSDRRAREGMPRYSMFMDKRFRPPPKIWYYLQSTQFLTMLATLIIVLTGYEIRKRQKAESDKQQNSCAIGNMNNLTNDQRYEILFKIVKKPDTALTQNKEIKLNNWRNFMIDVFRNYNIWLIYGNKNIGKTTILENIIYDLQKQSENELINILNLNKQNDKNRKAQIIYVNLGNNYYNENNNEKLNDVEYMVSQLRQLLIENAKLHVKTCVVLDSIEGLLTITDGLDENMPIEKFQATVAIKDNWVYDLFEHFKRAYRNKEASFIIIADKPTDMAIEYMMGNNMGKYVTITDIDNDKDPLASALSLSKINKDDIEYVAPQCKLIS